MEGTKSDHIAEAGEVSGKVWYDVKQVMKKLNCSRNTVYRLVDKGELKPVRFRTTMRFIPEQVEDLMTRLEKEAIG